MPEVIFGYFLVFSNLLFSFIYFLYPKIRADIMEKVEELEKEVDNIIHVYLPRAKEEIREEVFRSKDTSKLEEFIKLQQKYTKKLETRIKWIVRLLNLQYLLIIFLIVYAIAISTLCIYGFHKLIDLKELRFINESGSFLEEKRTQAEIIFIEKLILNYSYVAVVLLSLLILTMVFMDSLKKSLRKDVGYLNEFLTAVKNQKQSRHHREKG